MISCCPGEKPWHVVHVIGSLRTGGAEKMLVNLLQAADRTDFRYTVLCLSTAGELAPQVEACGVSVKVYPVRFRNFPADVIGLARWFQREKVRIIHSHMYYATLWSHLAGMLAGVPVRVTTEHGKELWKNKLQIVLGRWLSRGTFRHIAVSEDVKVIRQREHGIAPEKILVIPNGVPIPQAVDCRDDRRRIRVEFNLSSDQPLIGTVGRVVEAKDYFSMVRALALVRKEIPTVHWLQVGDGPLLDRLRREVSAQELDEAVSFCGQRSDIPNLLRAMDLWVMSSVREGLPVSMLEAMAEGVPVVATDVGGIPDAVSHGESAWLVPPGKPRELAAGIVKVLQSPELAGCLAARAKERVVRDYSIQAVAGKIGDIYRMGLSAV